MAQSFTGMIIQVEVSHYHLTVFQRLWIDGKTVILSCDLHTAGLQILYGLIAAMVAKLEFKGFSPKG